MGSRVYADGGVLTPSEHHIGAFHDWVLDHVGPEIEHARAAQRVPERIVPAKPGSVSGQLERVDAAGGRAVTQALAHRGARPAQVGDHALVGRVEAERRARDADRGHDRAEVVPDRDGGGVQPVLELAVRARDAGRRDLRRARRRAGRGR